jgi:hypothetical protein
MPALPGSRFEGWNVGAVSIKRVLLLGGAIEVDVRRYGGAQGFSHGYIAPVDQGSLSVLLSELISAEDRTVAKRAISARARIGFIEILEQRWRRIAAESGLLFSPYVPFSDVEREGHERISLNGFTEAPLTIGRYATLLASKAFDGYINIGAFNCAPSNSASAVIHALSLRTDTPYAVIESDGNAITAS